MRFGSAAGAGADVRLEGGIEGGRQGRREHAFSVSVDLRPDSGLRARARGYGRRLTDYYGEARARAVYGAAAYC